MKNRVVCNSPGCIMDAWFDLPELALCVKLAHLELNPAHDVEVIEYPSPVHSASNKQGGKLGASPEGGAHG